MPEQAEKIRLPRDKGGWHPSVLPGQIVLVSTFDADGGPNLAPKSWITMAAFAGPMLAFGCNVGHGTYQNARRSGGFVVNIPDGSLAERIWGLLDHRGAERARLSGFTFEHATEVDAPVIAECRAHLECLFESEKRYGDEVMIFGRIVAAVVDAAASTGSAPEQYARLRPVFFLEDQTFGVIDTAYRIGRVPPTELQTFLIEVDEPPPGESVAALVGAHLAYLTELRARGVLHLAGAFNSGGAGGAPRPAGGGLYVVIASSLDDALSIAHEDPLVAGGAPFAVRGLQRSF